MVVRVYRKKESIYTIRESAGWLNILSCKMNLNLGLNQKILTVYRVWTFGSSPPPFAPAHTPPTKFALFWCCFTSRQNDLISFRWSDQQTFKWWSRPLNVWCELKLKVHDTGPLFLRSYPKTRGFHFINAG